MTETNMSPINYEAVRAANFALAHSEKVAAAKEAATADHVFDGGEWSGEFTSFAVAKAEAEVIAEVARRFGMREIELSNQIIGAAYEQVDRLIASTRTSK